MFLRFTTNASLMRATFEPRTEGLHYGGTSNYWAICPKPGIAGSVAVALEAEGRRPVDIPEHTGFRSEAFGTEPPQVYELTSSKTIDPLCNQWSIGALRKNALPRSPTNISNEPRVLSEFTQLVTRHSSFSKQKTSRSPRTDWSCSRAEVSSLPGSLVK